MIGRCVECGDEHGGAGERRREREECSGRKDVHGCGADEVSFAVGGLVGVGGAVAGIFWGRKVGCGQGDGEL